MAGLNYYLFKHLYAKYRFSQKLFTPGCLGEWLGSSLTSVKVNGTRQIGLHTALA